MRDWQNFFDDDKEMFVEFDRTKLREYLNAKIREAIEAAPKVYGKHTPVGFLYGGPWQPDDTHTARLIDVKPIEKGEA